MQQKGTCAEKIEIPKERVHPALGMDGEALSPPLNDPIDLETTVDPLLSQWARYRDGFIEAMTDDGYWTIDELESRVASRRAFFFPGAKAAMVGQIEVYPGGARVFQILWATGDVTELLQMAPGIEALARMMGCVEILIEGREAWRRLLEPMGYALFSVTLRKAL
jgi:hypothetical protein